MEFNIGWSKNNNVGALEGASQTLGFSYGEILEGGYEISYIQGVEPLHNFSFAVGTPSPIPLEVHRYKAYTTFTHSFGVK